MNVSSEVIDRQYRLTISATDSSENSAILELCNELQTVCYIPTLECGDPEDNTRKYYFYVNLPITPVGFQQWAAHVARIQAYKDGLAESGWG